MHRLGPLKQHYWKLQDMLRATGADAVSAFDDGALSSEDWAEMVAQCRGCQWTRGCKAFLAGLAGARRTVRAPDHCRNRAKVNALRAHYPKVA